MPELHKRKENYQGNILQTLFFGKLYFSKLDEFRFLSICFLTHKCFVDLKKSGVVLML